MSKITYDQLITDIANGRNREESLRLVRLLVAEVNAWRDWRPCGKCEKGLVAITIDHDDGLPPQHTFDMCKCFEPTNNAAAAVDAALTLPEGGE